MYEIWLVINILWEIALDIWPALWVVTLIWAFLVLRAFARGGAWRRSLPLALALGAVAALAMIPVVPSAIGSSLSDMGYWVDWANLLAITGGLGVALFALVWPLLASAKAQAAE